MKVQGEKGGILAAIRTESIQHKLPVPSHPLLSLSCFLSHHHPTFDGSHSEVNWAALALLVVFWKHAALLLSEGHLQWPETVPCHWDASFGGKRRDSFGATAELVLTESLESPLRRRAGKNVILREKLLSRGMDT